MRQLKSVDLAHRRSLMMFKYVVEWNCLMRSLPCYPRPKLPLRAMSGPTAEQQQRSVSILIAHTTAKIHADILPLTARVCPCSTIELAGVGVGEGTGEGPLC